METSKPDAYHEGSAPGARLGGRFRRGTDGSHQVRVRGRNEVEKLLPGGWLLEEGAANGTRDDPSLVRLRAARGHAEVEPLDVGRGAAALELLVEEASE